MTKVIAGVMAVTVSVGMGMAIGAGMAQATRATVSTRVMATANPIASQWYVAGAMDMMTEMLDFLSNGPEVQTQGLRRVLACLQKKGETDEVLTAWAKYRWLDERQAHPDLSATYIMIASACE
jgi:hypothetical protein